jgi:cephalosporin hydroxylase
MEQLQVLSKGKYPGDFLTDWRIRTRRHQMVTGYTTYKGRIAQQHISAFKIFIRFLTEIKPKRILEIGTGGGGFILFLRDVLDSISLEDSVVRTYDVVDDTCDQVLRENRIDVRVVNLFHKTYSHLEKSREIVPFIQEDGCTLVLCDGLNKVGEFRLLSQCIKPGDYIMAHDYVDTRKRYEEEFLDKIWNWCEIEEEDIVECSQRNNLQHCWKARFEPAVWVCKRKLIVGTKRHPAEV